MSHLSATYHLFLLGRLVEIECPWFTEARLQEEDMDCPDLVANDPQALFFYIQRMKVPSCALKISCRHHLSPAPVQRQKDDLFDDIKT